ncbi:hypothetical protein R1sor_025534 [Riccia sorocarpa]|uniref:Uncharacterized protein n=1 Tax=Riccia sorocarpa TaxID=122646 RepID=A0ABD3GAF3_9MARC
MSSDGVKGGPAASPQGSPRMQFLSATSAAAKSSERGHPLIKAERDYIYVIAQDVAEIPAKGWPNMPDRVGVKKPIPVNNSKSVWCFDNRADAYYWCGLVANAHPGQKLLLIDAGSNMAKVWEQMCHRGVPVRKSDLVYEDVWYQVTGKSLLLIFDDVDNDRHVELLQEIAEKNGCKESWFILTSRKSELLRGDDVHTIRPDHLGKEDAEKLLIAYALPKE